MTTPNSHADTARWAWIRRPGILATLAALLVALAAFVLGAVTDLSLGDENYHLRKATQFADAGRRLTHDPVYGPVVPPGIPYYDGPAWHAGLAMLWRLTGKSVLVAQAYQAAWLALFVGCAYAAGRALAGERAGWWALVAAATLPAALFFSVVLYVEVAMMALVTLSAALVLARRPLPAGLAFGMAFLVKPTVAFAFPALMAGAWLAAGAALRSIASLRSTSPTWRRRMGAIALAGIGTAALVIPDLAWRYKHLGTIGVASLSKSGGNTAAPEAIRAMLREKGPETLYYVSSLTRPADIGMYLGMLVVLGLAAAIVLRKPLGRRAAALWTVLGILLLAQGGLIAQSRGYLDVRYAMLLFPVLVLLAAMALAEWTRTHRRLAWVLVAAAILQGTAVGAKALWIRRIDPQLREAMVTLGRLEVRRPPGFVLCPESKVSTYSGRPILWAAINPGAFFFSWPNEKQWFLLDYFGVEYIAVLQSRIYAKVKHTGGYPRSFVDALPHLPYVHPEPVIDMGGLTAYRVKSKPSTRP